MDEKERGRDIRRQGALAPEPNVENDSSIKCCVRTVGGDQGTSAGSTNLIGIKSQQVGGDARIAIAFWFAAGRGSCQPGLGKRKRKELALIHRRGTYVRTASGVHLDDDPFQRWAARRCEYFGKMTRSPVGYAHLGSACSLPGWQGDNQGEMTNDERAGNVRALPVRFHTHAMKKSVKKKAVK
ncbi:hypothetical protein L210DRAFT_3502995 [Boletus edulis BED1]|uniref:Uncharacterized protein n=1 Tax=Boletus edulis BED1 TaxID=1328754 RepID=A0AAD4BZ18_BOLED|nr:hypothetical protein L210DRAFT_3502995 [Boletus edulis BED1]